jgi:hypothetical protein
VPRLVFVHAPGAVSDAGELLRALAAEARELGADVGVTDAAFPAVEGDAVLVFAPGDAFGVPGQAQPSRAQLRRSVAVCEAAPAGPLDSAYLHARRAAAALTPDRGGAELLRRRGIPTAQIELGWSVAWSGWEPVAGNGSEARPVEVACLAARGAENDRVLASFGSTLWRRRGCLLGPPRLAGGTGAAPPPPPLPRGEERLHLLRRSQLMLIGLGEESAPVERLRALQGAASGTVLVAAHGCELHPLLPGIHLAPAERRNLAFVADELLREPERLRSLRDAAFEAVRAGATLRPAAEQLLALAERVASGRGRARPAALAASAQDALSGARDRIRRRLSPPPNPARVEGKRRALEGIAARRAVSVHSSADKLDPRQAAVLAKTPSYDAAEPQVSVCVPLYEHADVLERALESVAGSEYGSCELLILDDASEAPSVAVARSFLERRPWLPALLLGRRVNQGLGRGRTDMARLARGELLFMLDADNELYPTALGRLAEALDRDGGAAFAYSLIEAHTEGRPRGLLSGLPWDPRRLREGNYIDAMAMIRRRALLAAGGYTEDLRLHGWEDFDLWCRLATRGMRGLLVPEILCRYSLGEESMIAVTNLDSSEAWGVLRKRYPSVLGGAPQPEYPPPPPDLPL